MVSKSLMNTAIGGSPEVGGGAQSRAERERDLEDKGQRKGAKPTDGGM